MQCCFWSTKGCNTNDDSQNGYMAYELCKKTKEKYSDANPNQAVPERPEDLDLHFLSYTNAVLESGVKIILEETKLESFIKNADFVITGEGRLDGQTVMGKAPIGVAEIAKKTQEKSPCFWRVCRRRCHIV